MIVFDVFQDVVCPWCRIGKKNLTDALAKWQGDEVLVRWHAYSLDPTLPEEGVPFLQSMSEKMGGADRLKDIFEHTAEAGRKAGLAFHFDRVQLMPNTLNSHLLIAYAPQAKKGEIIDRITKAYFEDGQNIGSAEVLADIAEETDLDAKDVKAALAEKRQIKDFDQDVEAAFKIGIRGVPFFIINNKYSLSGAQPPDVFLRALTMD